MNTELNQRELENARWATHLCRHCRCLWKLHDNGTWQALLTPRSCCDNAPMGDQIQELLPTGLPLSESAVREYTRQNLLPPTPPIALPVRAEDLATIIATEIVMSQDVTLASTVMGKIRWVARILEPHLTALRAALRSEGAEEFPEPSEFERWLSSEATEPYAGKWVAWIPGQNVISASETLADVEKEVAAKGLGAEATVEFVPGALAPRSETEGRDRERLDRFGEWDVSFNHHCGGYLIFHRGRVIGEGDIIRDAIDTAIANTKGKL